MNTQGDEAVKKDILNLLANGEMTKAKQLLDRHIDANPDNLLLYELYDRYLAYCHNDYGDENDNHLDKKTLCEERIKNYCRILELNPEDDEERYQVAYFDWGLFDLLAGEFADYCMFHTKDSQHMEKAIEVINKGIAIDKKHDYNPGNNLSCRAIIVNHCLEFMAENKFGERDPKHFDEVYPGSRNMLIGYYDAFINHVEDSRLTPEGATTADLFTRDSFHEYKADILLSQERYEEALPSLFAYLERAKKELAEAIEDYDEDDEYTFEEMTESEEFDVKLCEEKIALCKSHLLSNP